MAAIQPPTRDLDQQNAPRPEASPEWDAPEVWPEWDALLEENKQLRELVIRLSKLVIGNAVDKP